MVSIHAVKGLKDMLLRFLMFLLVTLSLSTGCISSRPFWTYVVDNNVEKGLPQRETGKIDAPMPDPRQQIRVVYSDGSSQTEVFVPVLASGQQIIIDQKSGASPAGLPMVPFAPTPADKTLEDAYLQAGNSINSKGAPVSIVKSQEMIRKFVKSGEYAVALQYADQVLNRYPNHVETLRTKGSLLLKMGEREAAIETYRKAEEVESSPRVREILEGLERKNKSKKL
jgi:tetratricopeptide (TPR) repeat protein